MDEFRYLASIGLDILSRFATTECKSCHLQFRAEDMISVDEMKERMDFKYVNHDWIIYHLILNDKVDREQDTHIVHLCSNCFEQKLARVKKRYLKAYSKMNQVKTFPATYRGTFQLDDTIEQIIKTYDFSGGKWNTVNKMKFWAAWEGYDIIYNITYDYRDDGNSVTGILAKLAN